MKASVRKRLRVSQIMPLPHFSAALARFIPDAAVTADAMNEVQTFRSEVNEPLPLSGHRSSAVQDEIEDLQS